MLKDVLFSSWAPAGADWSDWVKPVVFAGYHGQRFEESPGPQIDTSWAPAPDDVSALVIDLPGAHGVDVGLALAHRGYRPVPLYNAVQGPPGVKSLVDMTPVLAALVRGADQLAAHGLRWSAPPAFLLDADRRFGSPQPAAPIFDNRSVSFPTDFPSARLLQSRGVKRVILVQQVNRLPQADVAHTLRLWQRAGIEICALALAGGKPAEPIVVRRPPILGWIGYRVLMLLRLRSAPLGGFGGMLTGSSSSG